MARQSARPVYRVHCPAGHWFETTTRPGQPGKCKGGICEPRRSVRTPIDAEPVRGKRARVRAADKAPKPVSEPDIQIAIVRSTQVAETPAVAPAVTPPAPSGSLLVRGARQAGILPDRIQQSSKSKSIALPPMSRPAIGSAGKSESHIIQDCAEGNHPWKMTDPETGLAECARSPECSAIRQDTGIRPADTLRRFLYHNTLGSNNPRMTRNPPLRGDKATYLNKKCPRNICSDAPGIKCPH